MQWGGPRARRLLLAAALLAAAGPPRARGKDITHEDIKDAMLSLVHLMRDNTEKLERHEARDRQTDEQLKKALGLLTKRAAGADVLKSHLAKLEERVAGVEQLLAQRDERERAQLQKTADGLEELQSRLEGWATEVQAKVAEAAGRDEARLEALAARLPDGAQLLDELRRAARVLGRIDERTGPAAAADARPPAAEAALELLRELPRAGELRAMHEQAQAAALETRRLLAEAVGARLADDGRALGALRADLAEGARSLGAELQQLGKGQAVMMEMADQVLDTKKRLEHATRVLREVGELVVAQGAGINETLHARFDGISADIMDNQNGALANLTLKMEQEMNQVWRQINVMYQQMMQSAKALDRLHKQNEAYANGTTETMDGMESKVGEITKRMAEVDTNLNYLLGRLSLVTQEFNQIKEGLGAALDNIKASFREVQQRANDLSPGPHPLPPDYSEPVSESPEPEAQPAAFGVELPPSRR
ncbi:kinesin-like protein K39 [Phymastichus coffea]|uniref:kinesin-like protein K39 n=1 Tax=Phymastichus coffea TaxID=108790 RepID=UPI00273BDA30|nr:kinesin-like protein K39 [Phymastichus coffea]XP_058805158.1 kinesin-like protein K39 [Phymastichus coffea]